ncbi:MAG: universal stress protein [Gammaproteobacteria bacterium]|nr:universal stress protein [Gammaproteobacteria bacterium]
MNILVCVDLSDSTEEILKRIEELCRPLNAKVWLLHNAMPEPETIEFKVDPIEARESLAKKFHHQHRQIQEYAERFRKSGVEANALLVHGKTVDTILTEAADLDIDVIVVGSHGHGAMYQLMVGSISEAVLHGSSKPVLVIPTHERD